MSSSFKYIINEKFPRYLTCLSFMIPYADDLVFVTETLQECVEKRKNWKPGLQERGLNVSMAKTKFRC